MAEERDYAAQIRAIRLAIGTAEGLRYADGRSKAISQDEFAVRVGCAPSAVKKWELGQQEPELDSLEKINKIAPPELRFTLGGHSNPDIRVMKLIPVPDMRLLESALRNYLRNPEGAPLSQEEWEQLKALAAHLAEATKP